MKKILLDTNGYSGLLSGDERVLAALTEADTVYMSIFVLGELYAGFKGGNKERSNLDMLKKFLQKPTIEILDASNETAKLFGQLSQHLKRAGTPLPINDVWIAAHALETNAIVITYDAHF